MAPNRGCSCSGSPVRTPALVLIAVLGLSASFYLAPPAPLQNRLDRQEFEPTGVSYALHHPASPLWGLDYWSTEMPLGKLSMALEPCLLKAASAQTNASYTPKYLVLHSFPSQLCAHSTFAASECIYSAVETFTNMTGAPYFLPYAFSTFDGIIYQGILDNSLDVSRTIFEAKRILKPGGAFSFEATNRNVFTWILHTLRQRLLGLTPSKMHNWRLHVTHKEATRVLSAYNFTDISTSSFATSIDFSSLLTGNGLLASLSVSPAADPTQHYCMKAKNEIA